MLSWRNNLRGLAALLVFAIGWFAVSQLRAAGHLVLPTEPVVVMPEGERVNARFAVAMCHDTVRRTVDTPNVSFARPWDLRTYSAPERLGNTWRYVMTVDVENAFGATVRGTLGCLVDGSTGSIEVTRLVDD